MHNILNEPPPADLHGRLKFTVEKFVDAADIAGKTVLDIGCGYGWFELWAAKQGVKKITGLDMTAADLKTASENIRLPLVSFQEGGATALPMESGCCDTVVSWEVIEHIPPGSEPRMFAVALDSRRSDLLDDPPPALPHELFSNACPGARLQGRPAGG